MLLMCRWFHCLSEVMLAAAGFGAAGVDWGICPHHPVGVVSWVGVDSKGGMFEERGADTRLPSLASHTALLGSSLL